MAFAIHFVPGRREATCLVRIPIWDGLADSAAQGISGGRCPADLQGPKEETKTLMTGV